MAMAGVLSSMSYIASPAVTRRKSKQIIGSNDDVKSTRSECQSRPYYLNVDKAMQNKLVATKRDLLTCKLTGGGLVMELSTAYYEGLRSMLLQYLNENSELTFHTKEMMDQSGLNVQTTHTVELHSRKMYVINLYHTKCSILVNGVEVVNRFILKDWPHILAILNNMTIDGHLIDWSSLDYSIRQALIQKKGSAPVSTPVKSLSMSPSPPLNIIDVELDTLDCSFNSDVTLCISPSVSDTSLSLCQSNNSSICTKPCVDSKIAIKAGPANEPTQTERDSDPSESKTDSIHIISDTVEANPTEQPELTT
jgi:hypothetical protein